MKMDRRTLVARAGALVAGSTLGAVSAQAGSPRRFPAGFLWGAATAGHQVEGNNVSSDVWLAENIKPTLFAEPSGDADNSFELWPQDLDLVRSLGLNSYRFSLEWARIEPESGVFSQAMIDHYKRMIAGCRSRGLQPVVSFNHISAPAWFAELGGWTAPQAADLFARFCDRAARQLAGGMAYATTLNEPNAIAILPDVFPGAMFESMRAMNAAIARSRAAPGFRLAMFPDPADLEKISINMIAAHKAGKAAIKAARADLPVGVTLAITDDQAVGHNSLRDAKRVAYYGAWLDAAKSDDFVGVQNYGRMQWDDKGMVPAPADRPRNGMGMEIYPPSLAAAAAYAHSVTGVPILITEHGLGIDDDRQRAAFIPAALAELQAVIAQGVPVKGYIHWSLLDNFEWTFGYKMHFGLVSVDRTTFKRTPKPSAFTLGAIARRNAV